MIQQYLPIVLAVAGLLGAIGQGLLAWILVGVFGLLAALPI